MGLQNLFDRKLQIYVTVIVDLQDMGHVCISPAVITDLSFEADSPLCQSWSDQEQTRLDTTALTLSAECTIQWLCCRQEH